MIYRLEIENFYSIRDAQVLDLTIAPNVPDPDNRFAPIFQGSKDRAPKVVSVWGANASGKTTILLALDFLVRFIRDSAGQGSGFRLERFNDRESANRPIRLALELGGPMDYSPETVSRADSGLPVEHGSIRYELEISVIDGVAVSVAREALRQRPSGQGRWQRIFERTGQEVEGSKAFPINGYRHLLNTLKSNASVLASFALFDHPAASLFVDAARQVFSNGPGATPDDAGLMAYLKEFPLVLQDVNRSLGRIDVGVEEMRIVDTATGPAPMFKHKGLDEPMPWTLESHGTRAFIRLFPLLSGTLGAGGVAILDEFDTFLHPLLLPDILRWFHDPSRNPLNAQVWFSAHAASLLDELLKEEIVLCEKDERGRTTVFSLMDVKSVRRDENLYKKYLGGAFGAVPTLG